MTFKGLSAEMLGHILKPLEEENAALRREIAQLREAAGLSEAQGARDLLLYLKMSCTTWDDDTYGEIDDTGTARGSTTHTVVFDDGVLCEMLALANISTWGVHAMDALRSAVDNDLREAEKTR